MSTDNVTPIRAASGPQPPDKPSKKPRASRARPRALLLDKRRDDEGPTTRDVIRGLYGVCLALDGMDTSHEALPWLTSAAQVLASILHSRVEEQ
jgi:hypothetical protein